MQRFATQEKLGNPIILETETKGKAGVLTLEGFMLHHAIEGETVSAIDLDDHERLLAGTLLLNSNYPFMTSELQLNYDLDWPGFKTRHANKFVNRLAEPSKGHFLKHGTGKGSWYAAVSDDQDPFTMFETMRIRIYRNAVKNDIKEDQLAKQIGKLNDARAFYLGDTPELFTAKRIKTASAVAVVTIGGTVIWKYVTHVRR